jgi:hypothetical protein
LKIKPHIFGILLLSFLISCNKKEVGPQCLLCQEQVNTSTTDVLIGCEGNFGWGNASLSLYQPQSKTVSNQLFQNVNGFGLGDVLQSITEVNGNLYLVVNNSGKIEIIDTSNYESIGTLNGFSSPRYLVAKNASKGYCSDLYSGSIQIVDFSSKSIIGNITTNRWTEDLLIYEDYLYATVPDTNWVFKINTLTDVIEDTIIVGKSPNGIVLDKNNKIWILSSGGFSESIPSLIKYNPNSGQVENTFLFNSINQSPSNLRINKNKDELFYLNNGLQSFAIEDNFIGSNILIPTNGAVFYGMNIDYNTNEIYISDAIDYVQQGKVYRFDSIYQPLDTFQVGIIPNAMWFK